MKSFPKAVRGVIQNMLGVSEMQYQEYIQKYRRSSPNSEESKRSIVPLRDGTASSINSISGFAPNDNSQSESVTDSIQTETRQHKTDGNFYDTLEHAGYDEQKEALSRGQTESEDKNGD